VNISEVEVGKQFSKSIKQRAGFSKTNKTDKNSFRLTKKIHKARQN
jgi:hypothetical protein